MIQASVSQAATISLLRISNDRNSGVAELSVQTDNAGALQKIIYSNQDGKKSFSAADIAAGAVLEAQGGINALTLSGSASTGHLAIKHVYNGMTGEYRSCNMTLTRSQKAIGP